MSGIDEQSLRFLYSDQCLTGCDIAEGFGLHPEVIIDALKRWHITRPAMRQALQSEPKRPFDEATLRDRYLHQQHTIKEIADHYAISQSSVVTALTYWQIPRRRQGPHPKKTATV